MNPPQPHTRAESVSNNSLPGSCTSRQHFSFLNSWMQICGVIKKTQMWGFFFFFLRLHVWVNDCISSGLSCSWKADLNFGSRATLWVSSCTIGRCACLCQGTTCHSPPHSDTLCGERPSRTRHGQAKHASNGCLWSSLACFTPSVTLCLSSLTYSLSDTKSCVSYQSLCSMLKSSPVLSELSQLCYSLPPCPSHTHKYNNDCSCFLPMLSLCSCWMRYGSVSIGQRHHTQTHTCTYSICMCTYAQFPHNIIPAISLSLLPFLSLSDKTHTHIHTQIFVHTQTSLPELSGLIPLLLMCVCQWKRRSTKSSDGPVCGSEGTKSGLFHASSQTLLENTAGACLSYGHILS